MDCVGLTRISHIECMYSHDLGKNGRHLILQRNLQRWQKLAFLEKEYSQFATQKQFTPKFIASTERADRVPFRICKGLNDYHVTYVKTCNL